MTEAVKTLHLGGVVAHPTETCYGLAADVFNKAGVAKVYRLKGMQLDKPVSVLVRDLEDAERYGEFSTAARQLALLHWPGPLTIIVPRKRSASGSSLLPAWLNPQTEWIGFRVSSNKKARQLVEAWGGPLTTTSANISGKETPYAVQEILDQGLVPDFILDGGQVGKELPSTVVKVGPDGAQGEGGAYGGAYGGAIEILRQGAVKI